MFKVGCATELEHLYRIYSIPTHDKHQWLLLQFIVLLMMEAKGVRNIILVVVNKHNTARVASYWFIIHYRLVMNGNSNIKLSTRTSHTYRPTCMKICIKDLSLISLRGCKFLQNLTSESHNLFMGVSHFLLVIFTIRSSFRESGDIRSRK